MLCFESERIFFTKLINNKAVNMLSSYVATYPVTPIQENQREQIKKLKLIALL